MSSDKLSPNCPLCEHEVNLRQMSGLDAVFFNCPVCGKFEITGKLLRTMPERPEIHTKRYLISAYTLDQSDTGEMVSLADDNIGQIVSSSGRLKFDDKANHLLRRIRKKSSDMGADVVLDANVDYPSGYCRDVEEFDVLINFLVEKGWIEADTAGSNVYYLKTTYEGWSEAEKLQEAAKALNQAMFISGHQKDDLLGDLLDQAYESSIRPAFEDLGLEASRCQVSQEEKISQDQLNEVRSCRVVIADYTGNTREVYLLAGFALGAGIPVIHTCHQDDLDRWLLGDPKIQCIPWVKPDELSSAIDERLKEIKGLGIARKTG